MKRRAGFTLIELLVVVSIIALLVSILMPALGQARRQARRVVCSTQIKQIVTASVMYATDDERGMLPRGGIHYTMANGDEDDFDDAISIMFGDLCKIGMYMEKIGTGADLNENMTAAEAQEIGRKLMESGVMKVFNCPEQEKNIYVRSPADLVTGATESALPYTHLLGSVVVTRIGYNYLGGFRTDKWPDFPDYDDYAVRWDSADKLSDNGQNVLSTDKCRYYPDGIFGFGGSRREVSHARNGYLAEGGAAYELEPRELEGAGTNVGHLDGSVDWRPLSQTKPRHVTVWHKGDQQIDVQNDYTFW